MSAMIRISANAYYEDSQLPDVELCLDDLFYISKLIDSLLKTKRGGAKGLFKKAGA
jgi:hypothetical protein